MLVGSKKLSCNNRNHSGYCKHNFLGFNANLCLTHGEIMVKNVIIVMTSFLTQQSLAPTFYGSEWNSWHRMSFSDFTLMKKVVKGVGWWKNDLVADSVDEDWENVKEDVPKRTEKIIDSLTHVTQIWGECSEVGTLSPPSLLGILFCNFFSISPGTGLHSCSIFNVWLWFMEVCT